MIVIPSTPEIYKEAMERGILKIFLEAGAVVRTPTCGPCLGGYMGVLGDGEKAVSSSNRNFVGRIWSPKSEAYLANPAIVAASAVAGRIIHPDNL
jgi:3-isopropylmalate/(R)-2-methylmalate dehydratase large subunit